MIALWEIDCWVSKCSVYCWVLVVSPGLPSDWTSWRQEASAGREVPAASETRLGVDTLRGMIHGRYYRVSRDGKDDGFGRGVVTVQGPMRCVRNGALSKCIGPLGRIFPSSKMTQARRAQFSMGTDTGTDRRAKVKRPRGQ